MTKLAIAPSHPRRPHPTPKVGVVRTLITWGLFVVAAGWLVFKSVPVVQPAPPPLMEGRAKVIDGDGFTLNGQVIRLHGIDAFEYNQICGTLACGEASKAALNRLIDGKTVTCWPQDKDKYGRTVAICKTDTVDIAAAQVKSGMAVAYTRYSTAYVPLETEARRQKAGAWANKFEMPEKYRHP